MVGSNVIQFPNSTRSDQKISGSAEAANHLRHRFRERGRGQHETFVLLARYTFNLVKELKAKHGDRSGKMKRAFGELLKQKQRFVLSEHSTPVTLCQNPGNWIQVLRGIADELGWDADRTFLDAMRGSQLMPDPNPNSFGREQWMGEFRELISALADRLSTLVDYPSIATYLGDSGLLVENGKLEICEGESDASGIEEYGLYRPAALFSVPHVLGINYRSRVEQSFDTSDDHFSEFMNAAGLDVSLADGEASGVVRGGVRTALALVLDGATKVPTIALAEWEVLEMVFDHDTDSERSEPIYKTYATLGFDGDYGDVQPPNSVRFNLMGSPGFDAVAASHIVFPEIWLDRSDYKIWDPGGYVDLVEDFPTQTPSRTVAAVIERNLFYASQVNSVNRIDNILLTQLYRLQSLIIDHRGNCVPVAKNAQAALIEEWQAADGRSDIE